MAGIKEAMTRVVEHRNKGLCVAKGYVRECNCDGVTSGCSRCPNRIPYMIIQLDERCKADKAVGHGGRITVYDYGTDVIISDEIDVLDEVILVIRDNWTAEWIKQDNFNLPQRFIDAGVEHVKEVI